MAKKPDLNEALRHAARRPLPAPPTAPTALPPSNARPDRRGKKTVAGHFDPAVSKHLKRLALDRNTTVQELLREALNDFLQKHGLPPLA